MNWKKLAVDRPRRKGTYTVLISRGGKHIEEKLVWTTKAMWQEEKVEYWKDE